MTKDQALLAAHDFTVKDPDKLRDAAASNRSVQMTAAEFREWRKNLGWSQKRAADELGVSLRTIGNYEIGGVINFNRIPVPKMVALATEALTFREHGIYLNRP